jgi:hypothetical protein
MVRQAVQSPENKQWSKPGGLVKKNRKRQDHGKNTPVDLEHARRTGTERLETQGYIHQG